MLNPSKELIKIMEKEFNLSESFNNKFTTERYIKG